MTYQTQSQRTDRVEVAKHIENRAIQVIKCRSGAPIPPHMSKGMINSTMSDAFVNAIFKRIR